MKKANLVLAAALAAALVTGGTAALLVPATAVAQAQQKIGAKMMKPLKAAQEAIGQKNWEAGLAMWQSTGISFVDMIFRENTGSPVSALLHVVLPEEPVHREPRALGGRDLPRPHLGS